MLASDLGFLMLGGILGILAGAALIAVLRTRPPAPRQIRLTVTHGAVPIRPSATTLAGDPFALEPRRAALGGPGDLAWAGAGLAFATGVGQRATNGTPVRSGPFQAAPHYAGPLPHARGTVVDDSIDPTDVRGPVGFPIAGGPDPVLAAIATSGGDVLDEIRRATAQARGGVAIPVLIERPRTPVPLELTPPEPGVAILEAAIRARRGAATPAGTAGAVAVVTLPDPPLVLAAVGAMARSRDGGPDRPADSPAADAAPDDSAPAERGGADPAAPDPCAEPRHTVDERCALAERMRLTAERAADSLSEAHRTFDVHVAHVEAAAAIAESRSQRTAKDEAQNTFRTERGRAGSREEVEQAARDWLQEINRINATAREAAATLLREREAAAALQPAIERLTIEADAARVQAEGAAESCLAARDALAACEESAREAERAAAGGSDGRDEGPEGTGDEAPSAVPVTTARASAARAAGAGQAAEEEEGALAAALRSGGHPAILGLLAGDRVVMQRLVRELADDDPGDQRRWQIQLADLVDAIVSRAIEACAFVFPDDHPFWGPFNRRQGRDIALALSSLGFRFDGMGGFADERVPSQRDVSLALGYAGLDPMRVRRWPEGAELEELYRDVTVAADEYILDAAPGLTLGELVGILGRRADALTEVWNGWGQIRPILLAEVEA